MQIKLHHINLCTGDVPGLDTFYRDILDMKTEPGLAANRDKEQGYAGNVSFLTDGRKDATQFHLAEKDLRSASRPGRRSIRWRRVISPSGPTISPPSRSASKSEAFPIRTSAPGR